jgi:type IV pilus assembly protein PilB
MARKKIGDILLERDLISQDQLDTALQASATTGKRLGEVLVDTGLITEEQLTETVSERLKIPKVSLGQMVIDPGVVQRVPVEVARRYTLIPIFAIGNSLTLAMADPLNIIALDEIRYLTGCEIKRAVATSSDIKDAIHQHYSVADSLQAIVGSTIEAESSIAAGKVLGAEDAEPETPVVKLVNLVISRAVKARASDVHIEPDETALRVRYRVAGIMKEEAAPPKSMQSELISRIKVSANMDVSEKRLPQDGRLMIEVDGHSIDLRVSTLPTIHGEKVVIRILDRRNLMQSFSDLGFAPALVDSWRATVAKPEGLILISGPTSSGKTSTLYASLQEVNSIEKNIITVEDPVEYSLPLINQIQINEKAGVTFPTMLRSILRQNPDIIMIGEIRDIETARMAVRSALTGHLVFSTVHTNDAPSTITRLVDMGIENYLLSSALKGILAQRLVRVNCSGCRQKYTPSDAVLRRAGLEDLASGMEFTHGTGCAQCKTTGFKDQTGIFEFLEITPALIELILNGASVSRIREAARSQGYLPLFEAGLSKVAAGDVCLEELLRETSHIEDYFQSEQSASADRINVSTI